MRAADQLTAFVQAALAAGRSRDDIAAALTAAGWTAPEIAAALDAWHAAPGLPPVPRPRPYVSAREAFFYALLFASLAMTAWHLVTLFHALIDLWLPDNGREDWRYYGASSSIRWAVAALVVFGPLFLWLHARATRAQAADPGRARSVVRRWVGYLALFLAACSLLGDLIAVVYAFLSGDLTLRFLLKALVVAAVAGVVLALFRGDTEGDAHAR